MVTATVADTGVGGRRVEGHSAPAADADNADTVRIDRILNRKKVDGGTKIFRIDIGRSHIPGFTTAFSGIRRIKGDCQKAFFGQCLRIKTGSLFFDSSERPRNGQRRQFSFFPFGNVHIGRQRNSVTVVKDDFFVFDSLASGKGFVPLLRQL